MLLFEQSGREIALTSAGEELLTTVRRLDDVWNRFESAVDQLKGLKRGKLRVGLVTTAKYFLPRMLGAFCLRFPHRYRTGNQQPGKDRRAFTQQSG